MFVYKKVCIVVEKKIVKVKKHVGNYGELKNKKKKVGLKKKKIRRRKEAELFSS